MRSLVSSVLAGFVFSCALGIVFIPLLYLVGKAEFGFYVCGAAGLVFGLTLAGFAFSAGRQFKSRLPLHSGEVFLHQGPANHQTGPEAVGGWLYLTDERLVFVSHRINRFVHTWEVPLQAIARVELGLTMHLIPNGLRIFTTEGEHQFVVSGRGHWKRFITEAVHRRLTSHSGESVPAGPN